MSTIHNPTHFNPTDYTVTGYFDNQLDTVELRALNITGSTHKCCHCGNGTVRYITVCRHAPTQTLVVFGAICTDKLGFSGRSEYLLAKLQARATAHAASQRLRQSIEAFWQRYPDFAALAQPVLEQGANHPVHGRNGFALSVLSSITRYGSLTERQRVTVEQSLHRDIERAAAKAAAALTPKGDAPNGRVTVTGTVISLKEYSDINSLAGRRWGSYGVMDVVVKMLVELPNGARVFCTRPSGSGINRGDTVTVTATWTRKADDRSFATGKRPIVS